MIDSEKQFEEAEGMMREIRELEESGELEKMMDFFKKFEEEEYTMTGILMNN